MNTTNNLNIIKLFANHGNNCYEMRWRLLETLYQNSNFKLEADYKLFATQFELIRKEIRAKINKQQGDTIEVVIQIKE